MSDYGSPMRERDVQALLRVPGEGATVRNPLGGPLTFKARGEETNGSLTAFESTVAPGEGPPLHVHANEDEILYVVEGTLRFKLEGEILLAPPGSFAFVPRGARHTWQNVGETPARLLVIFTPSGMERFFESFGELPDSASAPEAFRALDSEVGMDVVGPPLAQSDPP
jgi:quercetin dioxygenase-like cupin family protein